MASPARSLSVAPQKRVTPQWVYDTLSQPPKPIDYDTAYARWAKIHDRKGYREYMAFCTDHNAFLSSWQPTPVEEADTLWEIVDTTWDEYFPKPLQELSLLGLDADTPRDKRIVKNAYRRKARKLHPDTGGNAESFKTLHTAYRKVLAITPA